MKLNKTSASYDALVYGLVLSITAPHDEDADKAVALAESFAENCNEKEVERAKLLSESIVELFMENEEEETE
jgi:hypothetical protein